MQIVISVPDEWLEGTQPNLYDVMGAVMNGTVLPEHYGDLKDVDAVVKAIEDRVEFLRKKDAIFMRLRKDIDILGCIPKIRCEVPTIIPAMKGESNADSN